MTFFRQSSSWRDTECLSAVFVTGATILAVAMTCLPTCGVPRCLLKTWTGLPCFTCGSYRAVKFLVAGHVMAAFDLQPLLTMLTFVAMAWSGYAFVGALFGLPRIRARATRCELRLLVFGAMVLVLANWVYLIANGR